MTKKLTSFLLLFFCACLTSYADIEPLDTAKLNSFNKHTEDIEVHIEKKQESNEEKIKLLNQILQKLDEARPGIVIKK